MTESIGRTPDRPVTRQSLNALARPGPLTGDRAKLRLAMEASRDPIIEDLLELVAPSDEPENVRVDETLAIAFFDLVGSTARKLSEGHLAGVLAARTHNDTCRAVVERLGGEVIKELGDGVLAVFSDPLQAVLAAVNARAALALTDGLQTKIGLTLGRVERVRLGEVDDVLGAAVDRCTRLQSAAGPNQIVLDSPLVDAVRSYIGDYRDLQLAGPEPLALAGLGPTSLYTLLDAYVTTPREVKRPFSWNETGRMLVTEKAQFSLTPQLRSLSSEPA